MQPLWQDFLQNSNSKFHLRKHTGEKPHKYSDCGKIFSWKYHLGIHMGMHTGEKPKLSCHYDQVFLQNTNFRLHLRKHTGEWPHKCGYWLGDISVHPVSKDFLLKIGLYKHIWIHTNTKRCTQGMNHINVPIVNWLSHNKSSRDTYENTHWGKPYLCSHCDQVFLKNSNFKHRLRKHTGERS